MFAPWNIFLIDARRGCKRGIVEATWIFHFDGLKKRAGSSDYRLHNHLPRTRLKELQNVCARLRNERLGDLKTAVVRRFELANLICRSVSRLGRGNPLDVQVRSQVSS